MLSQTRPRNNNFNLADHMIGGLWFWPIMDWNWPIILKFSHKREEDNCNLVGNYHASKCVRGVFVHIVSLENVEFSLHGTIEPRYSVLAPKVPPIFCICYKCRQIDHECTDHHDLSRINLADHRLVLTDHWSYDSGIPTTATTEPINAGPNASPSRSSSWSIGSDRWKG